MPFHCPKCLVGTLSYKVNPIRFVQAGVEPPGKCYRYRCSSHGTGAGYCNFSTSVFTGTFFFMMKKGCDEVLFVLHHWLRGTHPNSVSDIWTPNAVSKYYRDFRALVTAEIQEYLDNNDENRFHHLFTHSAQIGGVGKEVQIDEVSLSVFFCTSSTFVVTNAVLFSRALLAGASTTGDTASRRSGYLAEWRLKKLETG